MKKASLPLAGLLLLTPTAHAQDGRAIKLGIKAAPSLGWMKSDTKELKGDGLNLGFAFGLMTDIRLGGDNYALSTGVFLNITGANQKSSAYSTTIDGLQRDIPEFTFARRYQYVEVPVLIKLKTNEIGYMTYYGQLGFGSAFNVAAKGDRYVYNADNTGGGKEARFDHDEKVKVKSEVVPFRASLVVGVGAEYKFAGNTTLVFGLNYNNGFTDNFTKAVLFDRKDAEVTDHVEVHGKLHYGELLLGVYF